MTGRACWWALLLLGPGLWLLPGCRPPATSADGTAASNGGTTASHAAPAAVEPRPSPGPAGRPPSGPAPLAAAPGSATLPNRAPPAAPLPSSAAPVDGPEPAPIRPATEWLADPALAPQARTALAHRAKLAEVEELFRHAAVAFPPAELLWRGYKRERQLEVWASSTRGGTMTLVATYEICAMSGDIGPKRREGDFQVPEGFYQIAYLWPWSAFHLSMNIGYPNRSDRILGGPRPGSAIMIHGNCVSAGCLAMSDERIEELWVMAASVARQGERVHLHLYPSRELDALLAEQAHGEHRDFWQNLREGWALFEEHRRLVRVGIDWRGRYTFSLPAAPRG